MKEIKEWLRFNCYEQLRHLAHKEIINAQTVLSSLQSIFICFTLQCISHLQASSRDTAYIHLVNVRTTAQTWQSATPVIILVIESLPPLHSYRYVKLLLTFCSPGHEQSRSSGGNGTVKPQTEGFDTSSAWVGL